MAKKHRSHQPPCDPSCFGSMSSRRTLLPRGPAPRGRVTHTGGSRRPTRLKGAGRFQPSHRAACGIEDLRGIPGRRCITARSTARLDRPSPTRRTSAGLPGGAVHEYDPAFAYDNPGRTIPARDLTPRHPNRVGPAFMRNSPSPLRFILFRIKVRSADLLPRGSAPRSRVTHTGGFRRPARRKGRRAFSASAPGGPRNTRPSGNMRGAVPRRDQPPGSLGRNAISPPRVRPGSSPGRRQRPRPGARLRAQPGLADRPGPALRPRPRIHRRRSGRAASKP